MKSTLAFTASVIAACTITAVSTAAWAQSSQPNGAFYAPQNSSYTKATNLNAYINQLRLKSDASGDLYVAEAKAREECAVFGVIPSYADDEIRALKHSNAQYAQIRISMYERLKNRCMGFVHTTSLDRASIPSLYKRAAQEGNAAAIAHDLVASSPNMYSSTVRVRTLSIISTKNPAAIFELSGLFGTGGPLMLTNGINLNANESVIVWRLVACDLGYDCSSSSSLVQQSCLFGGLCGDGGYRENIQNAGFPPHQFQEIVNAEGKILAAIRDGSIENFIRTDDSNGSVSTQYMPPIHTREPRDGDEGRVSINASDPPYNNVPALQNIGIGSNYDVRSAGDTSAAANYRLEHGLFKLKTGSTFKIKYQDKSEESVLVVNPNSSLGAVPIPRSQVSNGGGSAGSGGGGPVIIPAGTGGSSSEWACTSVGSGDNEVWSCQQVNG